MSSILSTAAGMIVSRLIGGYKYRSQLQQLLKHHSRAVQFSSESARIRQMQQPVLYHNAASPPARCAVLMAKTLNLDVQLVSLDLSKNEHRTPEFLALNPQHTVPTLVTETGDSIWDSHAIVNYLVDRYAPGHALYPTDLLARAQITRGQHFETSILFPLVLEVYYHFSRQGGTSMLPATVAKVHEAYALMETLLGVSRYLAGPQMSVADVSAITSVTNIAHHVPVLAESYPLLAAWMGRFSSELPGYDEFNTQWLQVYVAAREEDIRRNRAAQQGN